MADKTCFVIAPIGEAESETRKRSDQVLNHVITPAVQQFGYAPLRADHISEPGLISNKVIQHIVNDPLVVADLTGHNPNVFYELALRHALRSPLVQIMQAGEQIPFDVAGTRTIYVDHQDLDSVANAKEEIVKQVTAIEKEPENIETPISVSIDLQNLKKSDNPEQRSLGDLLTVVTELRTGLANVEKRLDYQIDPLAAEQVRLLENNLTRVYQQHSEVVNVVSNLRALDLDDPDDPATVQDLNMAITDLRLLVSSISSDLLGMQERISELSGRSRRTISGSLSVQSARSPRS
jgi:hypothetical protein